MKKIYILILIMGLGISLSSALFAQSFTSIQYNVGIPFGGLKDHTDQTSWRGMSFEYHRAVTPEITVGANLAYSVFYQRMPYGSYTQGNATLSGVQYRYNNLFPMAINAHYTFGRGEFRPYAGIGAGTVYDLRNTDMGMISFENREWHFLICPEAGILFSTGPETSIKLNVKYDNAFKTKDADAFGNMNINIGFLFRGR